MEIVEVNDQLRESEERYQYLVQMLPDGLIVYREGDIVFANRALLTMLSVTSLDEIIGHPVIKFVPLLYRRRFPAVIDYLIQEANPLAFTNYELLRLDQATVEIELRAVSVKFDGINAIQLIIHDISNRKKMEASLHEKDYLYKSLMESVVAGVFVGRKKNLVYVNPYLADMFGYTIEEMYNLSSTDLVDKNEINRYKTEVLHGMASGVTQFPFKCKGIKKDGSIICLEGNSSIIMFDGQISLLGTVQDVTFKRENENMLRDNAKLYQKIIKFVPEPIVMSDEGIILYANKLAMQAIGVNGINDVIGKNVIDFIHPSYHALSIEQMKSIMSTDEATSFEERILVRPDGQLMDVEISSIRINNYMGKNVMLSVIRDLTDRKRSEEILIRSEKLSAIGQLAAGVAHEIRNPLTALKGFTQLLSSKYPENHQYFTIMANEIDRIALIVNEFMTLAKPHLSNYRDKLLEPILRSVISILETQAILFNVELKVDIDSTKPLVYCNVDQLKQVFLNIIKNAIEAMPEGGEAQVTVASLNDGYVQIVIKDCGPGIPEELIKRIGEPFVTTKEKGTGLGFMISTRIIDAHKGTIKISSVLNEGTTVEIRLPIAEQSGLDAVSDIVQG